MQLDEFKSRIEARNRADLAASPTPEAVELATLATIGEAIRFSRPTDTPPSAVDPSFWLTIIQLVAPLILEWINRRFPRPPVTPPTP